MRNIHNLYIVEGEVEEAFFKGVILDCKIPPGKVKRHKVLEEDLSTSQVYAQKNYNNVVFVIDTDKIFNSSLNTLTSNVNTFKAARVLLLLATEDFEDEIIYSASLSLRDICILFGCKNSSKNELKRNMIKHRPSIHSKINNLEYTKLYKRDNELKLIVSSSPLFKNLHTFEGLCNLKK